MKQLNPTFTSNLLEGSLSSYPASDFVNPGLGNIVRPFGLYVPLYLHSHLHKKVKLGEQEGSGNTAPIPRNLTLPETTPEVTKRKVDKSEERQEDTIADELNKKKKEILDEAIYESFLHPRVIKTDTIVLKRNKSQSTSKTVLNHGASEGDIEKKKLKLKHSFHIVE